LRLDLTSLKIKKPVPLQGRAETRGTTPLLSHAERLLHAFVTCTLCNGRAVRRAYCR